MRSSGKRISPEKRRLKALATPRRSGHKGSSSKIKGSGEQIQKLYEWRKKENGIE